MKLDDKCSKHFIYRSLIECGETCQSLGISNLPLDSASWDALAALARELLDPVVERFGEITLTYGFCSPELAIVRKRLASANHQIAAIYPSLDQHACYELNQKKERVCTRGGAACDFLVPDISSLEISLWIAEHLPFDRLYFYAPDRPIHLSYNSSGGCQQVSVMQPRKAGRGYVPATMTATRFLERFGNES
ncbi:MULTISPECIES: hypothetical protein [unclassified Endozoicomonas]|uniref:hypothetical protein n=1 Tax=unclassified Endozoicomonas TaxID=2644528 RepID=UPI003BB5A6B5